MSGDQQPAFPGWEERYQQQAVETMPWFYPELDDDLRLALDQLGLQRGNALDLGAGPGTQAMQLAQRGFDVTATDISEAAIRLAREKAESQGLTVSWQQDDILSTRLTGPFDLIFDRGCFHVLPSERRVDYVATIIGLAAAGVTLVLAVRLMFVEDTRSTGRLLLVAVAVGTLAAGPIYLATALPTIAGAAIALRGRPASTAA